MIRRAVPEDADAIAELYERSLATLDFLPVLHTLDEHRSWFARVVDEQEVWVYDEGAIVGFAALDSEMLNYLYLEPFATGRGIGNALLDRVKERLPDGFRLWTFQQNEGARRFYERHGLEAIEFTDGAGNEERTPDVLYEWRPPNKSANRDEAAGDA
jgi:GNAT superfamily N-acetyltransferase